MAGRLADSVAQIENVRQLETVVAAMRGIAASRAQKGRALLAGVDAYSNVVSRAIGQALALQPADGRPAPPVQGARSCIILFCAEQGFAGAFSERVLDAAARDLDGAVVLLVGTRGATVARERGLKPAQVTPMATHVEAIPTFANRLAEDLFGYVAAEAIAKVDILFSRSIAGQGIDIDRHSLLPIDFTRFARPVELLAPMITLGARQLIESLAEEYVYAQLCEAALHAFEAENQARMMAMAAAKTNIETKLTGLVQHQHQLRQDEITTEIIELAAGAEASKG
ncbi:MAG: F0F1 ATP synthase subunit gamma [Caulobacter sp.]|nr:F0F1 ATP synthase subunit gamma [Caulobacter sp.]